MSARSLDQWLAAAVLASAANRGDTTGLRGSRQVSRPDKEVLEGEIGQGRRAGQGGGGGARPLSGEREAAQDEARTHAGDLARGEQGRHAFYDRAHEGVDGAARAAEWAKSDKRHFRIILSAERGDEIGDLPAYTREVMARAEVQLGSRLSWVAADHHDTGHSHTHIILRGRRANGQDLVIPKDVIRHGFRNIARDVATEWLCARTRDQAREALDREVMRHAPTRLDRMIADQLPEGASIRVSRLVAPEGDRADAEVGHRRGAGTRYNS
jgi:hypothetical protein